MYMKLKDIVRQLKPFQLLFGTSAVESSAELGDSP